MPFQVNYDPEIECVVTVITGNIDKDLVFDFFLEVGKVAAANNCNRILSDLRDATIVSPTTDIYGMAQSIDQLRIQKSFRRAIVISQDHQDYQFWETVCHNQGHQMVKIFHEYPIAKQWVLKD